MCAATSGLGNFHDIVLCFHLCASMTIALTDFKFLLLLLCFFGVFVVIIAFVVVADVAFCPSVCFED